MVKPDVIRDSDGAILCNVVASCSKVAVMQVAVVCPGCDNVVGFADKIGQVAAEHDKHARAIDLVLHELRERAAAGGGTGVTGVEELALRLGMQKVQELGEQLEGLRAAHAAVLDEHTHPVFACKAHERKLPALST